MASNSRRLILIGAWFMAAPLMAQQAAPEPAIAPQPVTSAPVAPAPVPASGVHTIGELDRIQSELIIAQARRQLAEAKKALEQTQGDADPNATAAPLIPVVAGVFGPQAQPYARFLLGAGAEAIGRPGDVLPGNFRVVSVSVERVVIKDRAGRVQIARFSSTPPESVPAPAVPVAGAVR
jgi:type IV pilus biogenesis protein PilP